MVIFISQRCLSGYRHRQPDIKTFPAFLYESSENYIKNTLRSGTFRQVNTHTKPTDGTFQQLQLTTPGLNDVAHDPKTESVASDLLVKTSATAEDLCSL